MFFVSFYLTADFRNKRTTDPFCVQFAMGNRGAGIGKVETKAVYYNNLNQEKSAKVLDNTVGEVRVMDQKSAPWHLKKLEAPSWDHRMKIRWTITQGSGLKFMARNFLVSKVSTLVQPSAISTCV